MFTIKKNVSFRASAPAPYSIIYFLRPFGVWTLFWNYLFFYFGIIYLFITLFLNYLFFATVGPTAGPVETDI
jgi:hypothetical protein